MDRSNQTNELGHQMHRNCRRVWIVASKYEFPCPPSLNCNCRVRWVRITIAASAKLFIVLVLGCHLHGRGRHLASAVVGIITSLLLNYHYDCSGWVPLLPLLCYYWPVLLLTSFCCVGIFIWLAIHYCLLPHWLIVVLFLLLFVAVEQKNWVDGRHLRGRRWLPRPTMITAAADKDCRFNGACRESSREVRTGWLLCFHYPSFCSDGDNPRASRRPTMTAAANDDDC